jgi:protoporphyrinogen oxidase
MKFIVLGAGLSGLTCAAALRRQGHEVQVLEKEGEVGGLARSVRVDGYTFDLGPHFLFGPKVCDLLRREFPRVALNEVPSTKEKMYFHGKYFNFPFDPKNVLVNMDRRQAPGVLCDLIVKRTFGSNKARACRNVEEWVVQAVGRHIYDYISLGGYIAKLYGLPPTQVSYEWGMQKLKFLARWREASLVTLALRAFSEKSNISKRVIHYPPGGVDHLAVEIFEFLRRAGGKVHLNTEAVAIEHRADGISVRVRANGEGAELRGDFLVSTAPVTHLVGMLVPAVPTAIRNRAKSLRYRILLLLYLFVGKNYVLNDQCLYFTENQFFFRRITEFKHLDEAMAPAGKTSLCIEVTCFDGDEVSHKSEREVLGIVIKQLDRWGYLKESDIEGYRFLRIPFAYPVYELNYDDILRDILTHLRRYENMVSMGRQGLFFYNAMNSSIMMSHELGEKLGRSDKDGRKRIVHETYEQRLRKYGPEP